MGQVLIQRWCLFKIYGTYFCEVMVPFNFLLHYTLTDLIIQYTVLCVFLVKRDYFCSRCNTLNKCLEERDHKKLSQSALEELLEENRYIYCRKLSWSLVS